MKYLKISILSGVMLVIAYACKKSFLNKAPIGSLDPTALANANGVKGILIGAYALLDGFGGAGGYWASAGSNWVYGSVAGTESHKGSSVGDQPDAVPIESFHPLPTNGYFESKWQMVYDGVSRSNDVIRTAALATDISASDLAEILGQARALRAWYHFEAKKMWDKIPFIDETITYANNNYFVGNDVDAWPLIEADLQFAVANLPVTSTTFPEVGRIMKLAAEAILAKVYMFEKKFSDAKPLLEDIINSGKYDLNANYHDNFNILTKNSKESILGAQSSVNDGAGGNNGNWGDVLNFPYGGSPGTCCGFNQPSQWFVDHFQTDANGLPFLDDFDAPPHGINSDMGKLSTDPFTPYAGTVDSRLDWSVGRRGIPYLDWGVNPGNDWIRAQSDAGPYSPIKNVYPNALESKYTDASFWSSGSTAMNTNLIRFADVLLWHAEVAIEVDGAPGLEEARADVNRIRARAADPAGWVKKYLDDANPQGGFSNTNAANYKVGLYQSVWTDADFARKAVRFERLLELGMEGHRHFDLVRWGIAADETNRYLGKEKSLGISYMQNVTYTAPKNDWFPIPQTEIDLSQGKLTQPYY